MQKQLIQKAKTKKLFEGLVMKFCRLFQNIFLIGSFIPLYGQVSVTASVSHNTVSKSETFSFKIVALNANESPSVDVSPLGSNFKVISGPAQQTNIQWVNGSMTSSRSLSWTLLALQSGRLNIPSLNVRVGSQVYKTNPIGITVEKRAWQSTGCKPFHRS